MREDRADHRVPAYQHRDVTLEELRQRNEKLVRRLLWMAWPYTAEATLHRLRTDAMSFCLEESVKGGVTRTSVIADIRNRDIMRNAPVNNPDGPMFTAMLVLDESDKPRITDARIRVKRDCGDFGEPAADIEEAVMMMELIGAITKEEYATLCEKLRPMKTSRRQSTIMHMLIDLKRL
jgi:hypothetical protein